MNTSSRTLAACAALVACLALVACAGDSVFESEEELGEALFHDPNLSLNRTMACATCHDPERAFTDGRLDDQGRVRPASLGDDGVSLGDRNAPTAAYAQLTPEFAYGARARHNKQNQHKLYEGALGGLFWDGRALELEAQAGGPPLNLLEMGMPDEAAVVARLLENEDYERAFVDLYGADIFDRDDEAYAAMTRSIAAYERTELFAPFDSRYDRSLRGDAVLSFKELTGKAVFFSQFANCAICHQLYSEGDPVNETREPFTSYEFHNIGVPANEELRAQNGVTELDDGLLDNAGARGPGERGKFKVPTLRNVAVTGPYMHNGVFRELRTTLEYYDHFNNPELRALNPETGAPWAPPEVADTVADELLRVSDPLADHEIEGLVCFLRALTDQRYEHLLADDGVDCSD